MSERSASLMRNARGRRRASAPGQPESLPRERERPSAQPLHPGPPAAAPSEMTGRSGTAVVAAAGVTRVYGARDSAVHALRGVSLRLHEGQMTAIMGPSGSGKSTLLHILAGLDRPTTGAVSLGGTDITRLGDDELTKLRRRIGFVFQSFNLLPTLSAEENILLPLTLAGEQPQDGWIGEIVDAVGIRDRLRHMPTELSGGQQQRVAIARALVGRPAVVFADEPTGNLDSRTSADILELLRRTVDDYGHTTAMVTHDPQAATIADEIVFLADGKIVTTLGPSSRDEVLATMAEVTRP
jgi:putative ABC transport system ATP-binding protein